MELLASLLALTAFIIALTVHEFCHAWAAYLLGDPTAKLLGRLTLNPLAHIDPIGLLCLIFLGIGWAKPVPFNPRNFSYPRIFSVLVGFSGPASNFVMAIASIMILHNLPVTGVGMTFFQALVWINVMLGIFNMIPLPPLDGSHLLRALIPNRLLPYYQQFERFSFIVLLVLLTLVPAFRTALITAITQTVTFLETTF